MTEPLLMSCETRSQIGRVLTPALREDLVAADNASLDLVEENLAAKLGWFAGFVPNDELGVGLEEAQEFLRGWNTDRA